MGVIDEVYRWACFNPDGAAFLAGMGACALWSAGYVLVTEARRHYKSIGEEREHIKPLNKD